MASLPATQRREQRETGKAIDADGEVLSRGERCARSMLSTILRRARAAPDASVFGRQRQQQEIPSQHCRLPNQWQVAFPQESTCRARVKDRTEIIASPYLT
eukprot:6177997-Pleurochrysis_carterae.AAC.1